MLRSPQYPSYTDAHLALSLDISRFTSPMEDLQDTAVATATVERSLPHLTAGQQAWRAKWQSFRRALI